eukprot:gb/GECH01007939.1/.p1 GENE.gb/GECH01007939.1/~~gb/GECH01007939.1/.p1  ORF type:complete len:144 (+),score=11.80 gb/GECH01007939.1/:1-432(+)
MSCFGSCLFCLPLTFCSRVCYVRLFHLWIHISVVSHPNPPSSSLRPNLTDYAFPYITLVAVYIGDMVHTSLRSRAEESASGKEKVKIALLFGLRFILGLWAIYCIIVFFSLSNLWFLLLLIGFGVFLCNICIFVCVTSLSQSG